jgi:hypothetical protein
MESWKISSKQATIQGEGRMDDEDAVVSMGVWRVHMMDGM